MSYTLKRTQEISEQQVEDLLSQALAGAHYWADEAYIRGIKEEDSGMWNHDAITHGYRLAIHDSEGEKWYQLTLKKFLGAIQLRDNWDFDSYDQYDADSILQVALFGEVIYG
jgi:hypothetical protein